MNEGVRALVAMLASGALLALSRRVVAPTMPTMFAVGRSAVLFASLLAMGFAAEAMAKGASIDDALPPLDLAISTAMSFIAGTLARSRATRPAVRASLAVATSVVLVAILAFTFRITIARSIVLVAASGLSIVAFDLQLHQRRAAVRAVLHAVSFVMILCVVFPIAVLHVSGRRVDGLSLEPRALTIAVVFASLALLLGAMAARAMIRHGGTPDPLDAPKTLVTSGPYAYLRHPLQLAEAMLVIAVAIALRDRAVFVYAALVTLTLVFPMRMLEELVLRRRFGPDFDAWIARTPAYFPRRSR